jgi:hypothetical protein
MRSSLDIARVWAPQASAREEIGPLAPNTLHIAALRCAELIPLHSPLQMFPCSSVRFTFFFPWRLALAEGKSRSGFFFLFFLLDDSIGVRE